ncbi:hypothetical protein B484DRAFT_467709, partial [Ochromonadaceae sp. CCMP2298]
MGRGLEEEGAGKHASGAVRRRPVPPVQQHRASVLRAQRPRPPSAHRGTGLDLHRRAGDRSVHLRLLLRCIHRRIHSAEYHLLPRRSARAELAVLHAPLSLSLRQTRRTQELLCPQDVQQGVRWAGAGHGGCLSSPRFRRFGHYAVRFLPYTQSRKTCQHPRPVHHLRYCCHIPPPAADRFDALLVVRAQVEGAV